MKEVPPSPVYAGLDLPKEEKRTVFLRRSGKEQSLTLELVLVDQPKLPALFTHSICKTVKEASMAIKEMVVRGAPAIGVTGAFGMVLAAAESRSTTVKALLEDLKTAKTILDSSRPTAVNLMWATKRMLDFVMTKWSKTAEFDKTGILESMILEANRIADSDRLINYKMAQNGAEVIPEFNNRPTNVLHHCNTGVLACVDWGTALGVIHYCNQRNRNIHVWVDETRPRLQGSRLSAWELMQAQCSMHLISDSVAGSLMRKGKVDVVLFGADRVAANGDTVNKIGSYNIAVLAKENGVPVYPVVPTSTIDLSLEKGDEIPIEERRSSEVTGLSILGNPVAPEGVQVYNPAFDNTPNKYITGIITEEGICYPPFEKSLRKVKNIAEAKIRAAWD